MRKTALYHTAGQGAGNSAPGAFGCGLSSLRAQKVTIKKSPIGNTRARCPYTPATHPPVRELPQSRQVPRGSGSGYPSGHGRSGSLEMIKIAAPRILNGPRRVFGPPLSKIALRDGARSAVRPRRMAARARRRHARHRAALKAPPHSPVFRGGGARAASCLRCSCRGSCPLSSTRGAAHDRRVGGARGRLCVQRRLGFDMRRNHAESARREPRAGAADADGRTMDAASGSSKFGLNKILKRKHSFLIGWNYRFTVQSQRERGPRPCASGGRFRPPA